MTAKSNKVEEILRGRSILETSKDKSFEFVAQQSFTVYPGWAYLWVFKHKETGELWGSNEYLSDDDSTGADPRPWFRVQEKVEIRYEQVFEKSR